MYDAIYAGNLYGNMYRIGNIGMNQVPVVRQIFDSELTDHTSPVTAKAEVAYVDDNDFWVYFGTGRYQEQVDKGTVDQQYFLGLQDNFDDIDLSNNALDELHEVAQKTTPYTLSDLVQITTGIIEGYAIDSDGNPVDLDESGSIDAGDVKQYRTISCPFPDVNGDCNASGDSWALYLSTPNDSGSERVISRPLIVAGIAFFTTFVPNGDPCEGDGNTWLFAVSMDSGEVVSDAVFDLNEDGTFDESSDTVIVSNDDPDADPVPIGGIYIGEGSPSEELVLHDDVLFVGTSTEPPKPIKVNLPGKRSQLKAWRQKFN